MALSSASTITIAVAVDEPASVLFMYRAPDGLAEVRLVSIQTTEFSISSVVRDEDQRTSSPWIAALPLRVAGRLPHDLYRSEVACMAKRQCRTWKHD